MSEDFYPFVDSGDPAPTTRTSLGASAAATAGDAVENRTHQASYTIRISVYDDMLSTPARDRGRAKRRENLPRGRYQHGLPHHERAGWKSFHS